jgi:hypothetical protein
MKESFLQAEIPGLKNRQNYLLCRNVLEINKLENYEILKSHFVEMIFNSKQNKTCCVFASGFQQ